MITRSQLDLRDVARHTARKILLLVVYEQAGCYGDTGAERGALGGRPV